MEFPPAQFNIELVWSLYREIFQNILPTMYYFLTLKVFPKKNENDYLLIVNNILIFNCRSLVPE